MDTTTETNDTYDPRDTEDQSLRSVWYNEGESGFWADREAEYHENPWYRIFVNYLTTMLTPDEFSGAGAEACKKYFKEIDMDGKLQITNLIRETCKYGTGLMYKARVGGKLRDMKTAYTRAFDISFSPYKENSDYTVLQSLFNDNGEKVIDITWIRVYDEGTGLEYYFKNWPQLTPEETRNDDLAMLRLEEDPNSPLGIAPGASCWNEIKGLKKMNKDILSGLNKLLASPILVTVDLDSVDDDQKSTELAKVNATFDDVEWGKVQSIAMDARHKAGFIGLHPDSSSSPDSRMLQPLQIAEPVFAAVIMSYGMALGMVLQTGANKSLIDKQESLAEKQIEKMREAVNVFFKTQIAPYITKEPVDLKYNMKFKIDDLVTMFGTGAISREKFQDEAGITDDNNNFFITSLNKVQPSSSSGDSSENNDDNPDGTFKGGR